MVADSCSGRDIVIKLYDNAFSPFARKVRIVPEFKGLDFDAVV
jgi:glutathione S-transferase